MARIKSSKKTVKGDKDGDEQAPAPASTKHWRSGSKLMPGGDLGKMSTLCIYDTTVARFSHTVKIRHTDAFTLSPLIVTAGPLKGKHVLVLEPVKPFSFLDLAAEIRMMIYRHLVEEPKPIEITTFAQCFQNPRAHVTQGLKFDTRNGKYIGQVASNFALACVKKQMAAEAAPVIHGDNVFEFQNLGEPGVFLEGIGSKCTYLKSVAVVGYQPYTHGKGRSTLDRLLPASNLRDFTIGRGVVELEQDPITNGKIRPSKSVRDARPFLRALHKASCARNKNDGTSTSVLDVFKAVAGEECGLCSGKDSWSRCKEKPISARVRDCDALAIDAQVLRLTAELRRAIADELRIDG